MILDQVTSVAVRMAILYLILGGGTDGRRLAMRWSGVDPSSGADRSSIYWW